MDNQDDILETALNSGIAFSAQKYNVTKEQVREIVMKFKNETGDPCECEMARKRGEMMMCFFCPGGGNPRIMI